MLQPENKAYQYKLPTAPSWIILYDSMIIILTAFFIMYSTNPRFSEKAETFDEQKIKHKKTPPPEFIAGLEGVIPLNTKENIDKIGAVFGEEKSLVVIKLVQLIQSAFRRNVGGKKTTVSFNFDIRKHNLSLSLGGILFFNPGKAKLSSEAKKELKKMADILRDNPYMVSVQAFADNSPIKTRSFPSNWELSSERAVNVMQYFLKEEGFPKRKFMAEGFGNKNEVKAGGNRRVEIVFLGIIPS